jgi:hypothetical protein
LKNKEFQIFLITILEKKNKKIETKFLQNDKSILPPTILPSSTKD